METVARARTLRLPRTVSPRAEPLAALARCCYPDMAVYVEEEDDAAGWRVRIAPVGELTRAHDSGIAAALAANGIGFDDMMGWHHLVDAGSLIWLEAMYHSWALPAWSHAGRRSAGLRPWLVHVAPHDDLGVPALLGGNGPGVLLATMEDITIDLCDPAVVRSAIDGGLIGVGSYIAPCLHAWPGDMVHLAPAGRPGDTRAAWRFAVEAETPGTASPLVLRECVDGPCSYRRTADPTTLADGWTPGQPVLLNISLAYFELLAKRRREPLARPCSIDELVAGLRPLAPWVVAVTVAYAPGSCPAERWASLSGELRQALMALFDAAPASSA